MVDGHDLVDERRRRPRFASDSDRPAIGRGRPRDRHVTAKAHQCASTDSLCHPGRRTIGGQRLGGGAEVEPDTTRDANGVVSGIELDVCVPDDGPQRTRRSGRSGHHLVQVGVVAERLECVPHGGVHCSARYGQRP